MTLTPSPTDPKLVQYLKKHLKRFGADALRAQLMEEGVPEENINAALTETQRRPVKRGKLPLLIVACAALIGLGVLTMNQTPSQEEKTPAPRSPSSAWNMNAAAGPKHPFLGHSGYVLQMPDGYASLSDFKDRERKLEVVYFFPKGTDPTNFGNEGIYAQLGILRLEVSPRRTAAGRIHMAAVREGVFRTLNNRKATFTMRETQVNGLFALVVNISEPFPLTQTFALGTHVMYVLTGGAEDPLFTGVLESLREVSP